MTDATATWEKTQVSLQSMREEIARVVVGQQSVVEQMLVALLCRGHCLVVGVPGLAKTLLVGTFGKVLGLSCRRIQFTPDLMPTDIVGSEILQTGGDGTRHFEFARGPIFANLILADEINRTPPKTQAALLEAMQEKQVTVAGDTMRLQEPFLVFATQNPIEHEGTYPLPEAQLDRFFFQISIGYPSWDEERDVLLRTTTREEPKVNPIVDREQVLAMQHLVLDMPVPDNVLSSILDLVHASRPTSDKADDYVRRYVEWGAGPRASQTLVLAAKALAFLRGEPAASVEEVRDVALPALRHRVLPNYNATGDGIGSEEIVAHLLERL